MTGAAVIAALYCVLTMLLQAISFGVVQLRVAEAMTLLPVVWPEAIPGLFIGCMLSNVLGGYGLPDVVFGSLATLVAAYCTRWLRKTPMLAALPPVLLNAVVVGLLLHVYADAPLTLTMLYVGLGQAAACYGLGLPLLYALRRTPLGKRGNADKG
ncbi:MAG: QueT transporter family protein [Clostridia bacterium]